jgi:hypothetical protein
MDPLVISREELLALLAEKASASPHGSRREAEIP